jgi:hypothetical protein
MSLKNSICSLEQERISCKSGLEAPNNCLLAAIACQISGLTLISTLTIKSLYTKQEV